MRGALPLLIARLIAKGYKVAICEQTEDPATAKGLVDRDIVRVITPGTVMSASMLEEGKNNFLCAIYADSAAIGLCLCDLSTGEVFGTSFPTGEEARSPPPGRRPGAIWKTSWAASTPPRRCCPTGPTTWTGSPTF